jgi:hypothetical protein
MVSGAVYQSYISSAEDAFDWFYFDTATEGTIETWLTDVSQGCDYDLYLLDALGDLIQDSANGGEADEHIVRGPFPPGRYHLLVVRINGWSDAVPYALRADFGQDASPTSTPETFWEPFQICLPAIVRT